MDKARMSKIMQEARGLINERRYHDVVYVMRYIWEQTPDAKAYAYEAMDGLLNTNVGRTGLVLLENISALETVLRSRGFNIDNDNDIKPPPEELAQRAEDVLLDGVGIYDILNALVAYHKYNGPQGSLLLPSRYWVAFTRAIRTVLREDRDALYGHLLEVEEDSYMCAISKICGGQTDEKKCRACSL